MCACRRSGLPGVHQRGRRRRGCVQFAITAAYYSARVRPSESESESQRPRLGPGLSRTRCGLRSLSLRTARGRLRAQATTRCTRRCARCSRTGAARGAAGASATSRSTRATTCRCAALSSPHCASTFRPPLPSTAHRSLRVLRRSRKRSQSRTHAVIRTHTQTFWCARTANPARAILRAHSAARPE